MSYGKPKQWANNGAVRVEAVKLVAGDGYLLAAKRYAACGPAQGNLIVAGATGVQQRYYRRFAEYCCHRGFNVLTLDYRGVGESRPDTLKGFEMNYLDWGTYDLAAAVDYWSDDELPLFLVGHSFGGHALGLLPNHEKLTACYTFGSGAGWAGWMPKLEALKVRLMWGLVLPVLVSWKGYMAWSLLGMGDDLPKGVYASWRRWCAFPRYFFDDPDMTFMAELYAKVKTPSVFATSVDDPWAPPRSRDAFVQGYCNADIICRDLVPGEDAQPIGHMGYFRSDAEGIWSEALDWLVSQLPVRSDVSFDLAL